MATVPRFVLTASRPLGRFPLNVHHLARIVMLVLTFQIGRDRLALDVRRVREVVPRVQLQQVAGSPSWLAGVFIYRGNVVPVIDLHHLIGVQDYPHHLSTRIILVPHSVEGEERLLGLLAAQVADIREMEAPTQVRSPFVKTDAPDLGPVMVDGREIIHMVNLDRLLPDSYQQHLSLVPRELPA
jgi:chemotaxis-related protein WspB